MISEQRNKTKHLLQGQALKVYSSMCSTLNITLNLNYALGLDIFLNYK